MIVSSRTKLKKFYFSLIHYKLFATKPSHDLLFIKIWAAYLRIPEMGKHVKNMKMAKFEAPGIKEYDFMMV